MARPSREFPVDHDQVHFLVVEPNHLLRAETGLTEGAPLVKQVVAQFPFQAVELEVFGSEARGEDSQQVR